MFHTEGEAAAARAALHHGTLYGLSSLATTGITEISKIATGPKVFQLYVWKDRGLLKEVLQRAKVSARRAEHERFSADTHRMRYAHASHTSPSHTARVMLARIAHVTATHIGDFMLTLSPPSPMAGRRL